MSERENPVELIEEMEENEEQKDLLSELGGRGVQASAVAAHCLAV